MTEASNLSERMTIFFDSLSHELAAGEQVELLWQPGGENEFLRSECFPDLKRASRRAASLGPACDVYLQATTEPGTTPWETENTQLLAYWHNRPRESGDPRSLRFADISEMRPLPYVEPSLVFIQCYPEGDTTCEAGWFYYRSRCPIRHRLASESCSPELEWWPL
jgi:hypothetical protein